MHVCLLYACVKALCERMTVRVGIGGLGFVVEVAFGSGFIV